MIYFDYYIIFVYLFSLFKLLCVVIILNYVYLAIFHAAIGIAINKKTSDVINID